MMSWLLFSVAILLFLHVYSIDRDRVWFEFFLLNWQRRLAHFSAFGFIVIGLASCAAGVSLNITLMTALYVGLGFLILFLEKPPKGKFDI